MSREKYTALVDALEHVTPPCSGHPRFIAEHHEIAPDELKHLGKTVCAPCPVRTLCEAYARAARPPAGIWAGRTYTYRARGAK